MAPVVILPRLLLLGNGKPHQMLNSQNSLQTRVYSFKEKKNASLSSLYLPPVPWQHISLEGVVTSPGFSGSKSCLYVFENSYKHLCKRKIKACMTYTFSSSCQCCLSMAWVKGIFLLLLFYPSSDKLHFSAVILSTKLSKTISYQLFPSRPPTIKAHSCYISFFPPFYFF